MLEEENIKWLQEREIKLEKLESLINKLQLQVNDNQTIDDKDDIKMEIFKLWYYNNTEIEYQSKEYYERF